jgi:hypothetical protein
MAIACEAQSKSLVDIVNAARVFEHGDTKSTGDVLRGADTSAQQTQSPDQQMPAQQGAPAQPLQAQSNNLESTDTAQFKTPLDTAIGKANLTVEATQAVQQLSAPAKEAYQFEFVQLRALVGDGSQVHAYQVLGPKNPTKLSDLAAPEKAQVLGLLLSSFRPGLHNWSNGIANNGLAKRSAAFIRAHRELTQIEYTWIEATSKPDIQGFYTSDSGQLATGDLKKFLSSSFQIADARTSKQLGKPVSLVHKGYDAAMLDIVDAELSR